MAATIACSLTAAAGALYLLYSRLGSDSKDDHSGARSEVDHPILKEHTEVKQFTTKHATYPAITTFYHPHAHKEKLEAISDLPLLVFVHGLGGSLPQFAPLLGSLVNVGPCFGIELPGHGSSKFAPKDYSAYKIEAFAELWKTAIEDICQQHNHNRIVLIAHSMGCSISGILTTTNKPSVPVTGIIGMCPKATPPTKAQTASAKKFLSLPDAALDLFRAFDRRGGVNSTSVKRFAGEAAGIDLKRLQLNFNQSFRTPVWKRSAYGCLPSYTTGEEAEGGLPGEEVWSKIRVPLFLIAGEADTVTKPEEVFKIVAFLRGSSANSKEPSSKVIPLADGSPAPSAEPSTANDSTTDAQSSDANVQADPRASDTTLGVGPSTTSLTSNHSSIIKTSILPAPAAHALMYDHATYRTVAGLIEDFLARYVEPSLSLGWQLQQLTTSGKWDVKNLEKWRRVLPVSAPIGPSGIFRAMKTLRERDEQHTPSVFIKNWADKIYAVIDISHDSPVYDTKALERGNIQYHKFPTVSKVPPSDVEVRDFIALVDRLRSEDHGDKAIGVHCHYGYNRTGFFIACYLIEKCGYRAQDAVDEFAKAKPPGIRHDHFIDTLFMRYHVGLKKVPTLKSIAAEDIS